jgi:multidrug efflux pump subunit AcrA (membrane-fusion protein)
VMAGRVSRIAAAADGATRTVPVEITLQAAPAGAHSGRIVSARIHPLPVPPRQAVPLAAIREGAGERAFVFVLAPGEDVVRRVSIDIELIDDGRVFLRSPLGDGLQVVTSGAQFLRDGSRVSITN